MSAMCVISPLRPCARAFSLSCVAWSAAFAKPEGPAYDSEEEGSMYIGVGTIVVILLIVLVLFLIRR